MAKVLILGASGMLGGMILDYFSKYSNHEITATVRNHEQKKSIESSYPEVKVITFVAGGERIGEALGSEGYDWIINAIGVIKPYIKDDDLLQVRNAIAINALLPYQINDYIDMYGGHAIQIATDCVYSGATGAYREDSIHDAQDAYGKTKSLGEVNSPSFTHLRCSIIGPEYGRSSSLLEWFLGQTDGAKVGGYANHLWNGVTTMHYAKICHGIIGANLALPSMHHIVPENALSKYDLLNSFATSFNRSDVFIDCVDANVVINRTLSTNNSELNNAIWRSAGYSQKPTIQQMVQEMASYIDENKIKHYVL